MYANLKKTHIILYSYIIDIKMILHQLLHLRTSRCAHRFPPRQPGTKAMIRMHELRACGHTRLGRQFGDAWGGGAGPVGCEVTPRGGGRLDRLVEVTPG